ncbi:MAG TPA: hypothetical protein VMV33_14335 [Rhodocyclaceae bacterium]|nr:hypothetical protein [Rhodocyclaceae bacterium]
MVTVLLAILIGLAMTATAFGVVHAVRSSQQRELSLHAATPAQATAWSGAELLRRYLEQVDEATLAGLSGALKISGAKDLAITIVSVKKQGVVNGNNSYRVVADLRGSIATDTSAASVMTLQAVYTVTPVGGSGGKSGLPTPATISTINIYKDLSMTGGIIVLGAKNANLVVDGKVTLDNASITGVNSITATGDVSIGSGIHVNQVFSNGNVTVTGAASVDQISALGNVDVNGGADPFAIQANGSVTFNGGGASTVNAIGDVIVSKGGVIVSTINTMGKVLWTGSGGGASSIHANGDVTYAGGNLHTSIQARGDVILTGGGAQSVTTMGNTAMSNSGAVAALNGQGSLQLNTWTGVSGTIGGALSKGSTYMSANVTVTPGYTVDVPAVSIEPLKPVTLTRPPVDAYALKTAANYSFDVVNGAIKVTVANMVGIDSGTYFLGSYPFAKGRGYRDFLCKQLVDGSLSGGVGQCSDPAKPGVTLCQGFASENDCLSYGNGTWAINGKSFARGILWFQGNVALGSGLYMDTVIATGNIATSGSDRVDAPNYAGFAEMCANATPTGLDLKPNQKADFDGIYPTNLCDTAKGTMVSNAIGNVGLLAGGYVDDVFSGGNINLGAATVVNGSVMAGNTLDTGGSTGINGSIVSAAQNGSDTSPVSWGGATSIDFSNLPPTYQPNTTPCMKDCSSSSSSNHNDSTILWTRYL